MNTSTKTWCAAIAVATAGVLLAYADQHSFNFPLYVRDFKRFDSYNWVNTNREFLDQFDVMVINMKLNANQVNRDNFSEVLDASVFEIKAQDSELNAEAAKVVNRMWARDFINDLNMYKLDYLMRRYKSASEQLLKEPVSDPMFEDVPFDEPLDKMVVYHWAYTIKQTYDKLMTNGSKLKTKWEAIKEKINTEASPDD